MAGQRRHLEESVNLFFSRNLCHTLHLQGCSAKGSLSKEDAAVICVEALSAVPQGGFAFEVAVTFCLFYIAEVYVNG